MVDYNDYYKNNKKQSYECCRYYLPSVRTVRTSALISTVALKHAAKDAKLGGDPVHITADDISGIPQQ